MKRIIAVAIMLVLVLQIAGCADRKMIDGVTYDTYGIINADDKKNPNIEYEVVWGNVFWGIVLFGTIIAPIYFFGFSLFEPVGKKTAIKGQVVR